jgi:hypothetical protein
MTRRGAPKWFVQWLAERAKEEEDAAIEQDGSYYFLISSEWMNLPHFIEHAERHFPRDLLGAEAPLTECRRCADELRGAIETAYAAREPWVRLNAPPPWLAYRGPMSDWLQLHPRAAVHWLLSKPMYRHLVPPLWARVVLPDGKPTPKEPTSKAVSTEKSVERARGPKPEKRDRVMQEMREMEERKPGHLGEMLEKAMEDEFRAGRTTCREARNRVLLES